jgi:phosphoserine phosphatase
MSTAPVLLTVTGRDHPGIIARLTGLLAQAGAQLLDVEQVVVQGQLALGLLVRLPGHEGLLAQLLYAAKELGVTLDFRVLDRPPQAPPPARTRYVATLVGRGLGSRALCQLATCLAEHGGNIEQMSRLSDGELAAEGTLESGALGALEVRLTCS